MEISRVLAAGEEGERVTEAIAAVQGIPKNERRLHREYIDTMKPFLPNFTFRARS